MSRIGRTPIPLPQGVTVNIEPDEVLVKGPRGELRRRLHADMSINIDDNSLVVYRPSDSRFHRSMHGLTRTLLANMVIGVSQGFEKVLEIIGVGYRAQKSGDNLIVSVGYSHRVEVTPRQGVTILMEGNNRIKVSGIDKEIVGQMAAEIRAIRPPDSYKGKGIRYAGEKVRLKAGKTIGKRV